MHRLLALLLLLVLAVPATSGDKKAAAPDLTKAVAPYLDEQTIAVVHVDLKRLDFDALLKRLAEAAKLEKDDIDRMKAEAGHALTTLTGAGVRDLYGVITLADGNHEPFVLVAPVTGNTEEKVLAAFRQLVNRGAKVERIGQAVVVGSDAAVQRLGDHKPTAFPELAKGFAAAGDSMAQVVVLLPATMRKALGETLPNLPEEVGGGSIKTVTEGFSWAAVGVDLTPKLGLRVVVQAKDADAAKALGQLYENALANALTAGQGPPDLREIFKHVDGLRELVTPKVAQDRLTLALGDKELSAALLPMVAKTRGAAKRAVSMNNLKQMALALHNYHDVHGSFPAHASYDKKGKALLSWRVHILPFIEQEALYREFKLDEPWDSDHNKKLIARMPPTYRDPLAKAAPGKTTYLAPVGKDTVFPPGPKGIQIRDITDGTSNTIMIVESDDAHAVIWSRPDDLRYDPQQPLKGLGNYEGQFLAAFADGSVRMFMRTITLDTLRALFTRNGGEVVGNDAP
jgi:hypothetical protein